MMFPGESESEAESSGTIGIFIVIAGHGALATYFSRCNA
jgi:hypothetical protein